MEWKEEYASGVEEIDKEHQGLFKAVNRLSHVLKDMDPERDRDVCKEMIKYMKSYTLKHFADEEKYQRSIGYLDYAKHKRQHMTFIETISYLEKDLEATNYSPASVKRLVGSLSCWLLYHVMNADQDIVGGAAHMDYEDSMSKMMQKLLIRVFQDMFYIEPEVVDGDYRGEFSGSELFCVMDFGSEDSQTRYRFFIALEEQLALRMVGTLLGIEVREIDDLVISAVKELANVIIVQVLDSFHNNMNFQVRRIKLIEYEEVAYYSLKADPVCSLLFSSNFGSFVIRA